jgi:hypothetical protein
MSKCYLCRTEITEENKSTEHIILNAIGGRLKSNNILCKDCNSKLGSSMDANLAKQLEFFANQLNIKRERGSVQSIEMKRKSTGEVYIVSPNGNLKLQKPLIEINPTCNNLNIRIKANNASELKKTFDGLKRKYPKLNKIKINNLVREVEEKVNEPLHGTISFDAGEIYPAILKMAINFYVDKNENVDSIVSAIDDLKQNELSRVEMSFFDSSLVKTYSEEVFHCIFVNGSNKDKKLYAFIELYSTLQFIVKLSDNYSGIDCQNLYIFDVLKGLEVNRMLNFMPDFDSVFSHDFRMSKHSYELLEKKLNRILQIGAKRRLDNKISEITKESFKAAFGEPDGRKITKNDAIFLVNEIMKRITPYIG